MKTRDVVIGIAVAAAVVVVVLVAAATTSYNQQISLRNAHEANEDANQVVYTKFVNILQEQAGVVNASVEAQKELFALIMNSKSGQGGGAMIKFIREHNPNPDAALTETSKQFTSIMNEISGLREEFARAQKKSLQIEKDHKDLVQGFFSSRLIAMLGGDLAPLDTNIVTAPETAAAFSGEGQGKAVDTKALFGGK